jgi:hypothetical protein
MDQQVTPEVQEPRAYEQPTITDHGKLAEVTAGPFGGGLDGLIGINNGNGGFNFRPS